MSKKSSKRSHKQKVYKMKGCYRKTRKSYLGGNSSGDINLAYPASDVKTVPNPFLAYTGKGGSANLAENTNGINRAYPSTGPLANGFNFLNPQGTQHGGYGCSSYMCMVGGSHRTGCKCSTCKMSGGSGIPYPNGLVGQPWTPSTNGWPGVDGVSGDRNYLQLNTYSPNDVSRQMIATGANPPFSVGGKKSRTYKRLRKGQKGGVLSNFLGQDLLNLGRQFQYGLGSTYNALAGYHSPVNPMPWKGQLANTSNLNTIKAAYI